MHIVPAESKQAPQVIQAEQRKTQFVGQVRPHKGHRCYELDLKTMEFEEVTPQVVGASYENGQVQKKLQVKDGHLYCFALNHANAERKFFKMLSKLMPNATGATV